MVAAMPFNGARRAGLFWVNAFTLIFCGVLLTACVSGPSNSPLDANLQPENSDEIGLELQSNAQLPESFAILGLPYFPQKEDQCGPASLATMLGARGIEVTTEELRSKVYIPAKEGSLTTEMVARARRYGLLVYPLRPKLSDVLMEVSAGNPVLVLQNLGLNWMPRWHFSVVTGYDLEQQTLTLRSGKHRNYSVNLTLFEKTWRRGERWAVVIVDPRKLPETAQESGVMKSTNELELIGEVSAALEAYKAMIERWPENSLAYFAAGNVSYGLGLYLHASDFFNGYIERSPESPEGWNNLAFSLSALHCHENAAAAMNCALQLSPGNPDFLESYAEISAIQSSNRQGRSCVMPVCQSTLSP